MIRVSGDNPTASALAPVMTTSCDTGRELGVSGQQVVGAVRAVGPMVADVKAYLQRKKDRDSQTAALGNNVQAARVG